MNNDLLSSYSFLAALTENGEDIYKAVYIPLFKRTFSLYAQTHTSGKDTDIQQVILEEYGINIPLHVTRKLIIAVANNLSRKDVVKYDFQVIEKGKSFTFKSFINKHLEEEYVKEKRNANALQDAFELFLSENNYNLEPIPSFASFIAKNKNSISSFFSGKSNDINDNNYDSSFMPHI